MIKNLLLLIKLMLLVFFPALFSGNEVKILRDHPMNATAGQDLIIEVSIAKGNISGIAKFQEDVPQGITASLVSDAGAAFSFPEQKARFIWRALPADSVIKIAYKIKVPDNASEPIVLTGAFSYVEKGETKKITTTATIVIGSSSATTSTSVATPVSSSPAVETPAAPATNQLPVTTSTSETPAPQAPAAPQSPVSKPESSVQVPAAPEKPSSSAMPVAKLPVTAKAVKPTVAVPSQAPVLSSIPAPQQGIFYRVQLAAAKKTVPDGFFNSTYKITDNVYAEMHQGWHKYTAGSFPAYMEARDFRNTSWQKGVKGAFVTAYNNGQRISVQEALLITKQKWSL